MLRFLVLILSLIIVPNAHAAWQSGSASQMKKETVSRLEARKKGFDQHQEAKKKWKEQRLARANEIKGIRKRHYDKMEKARKGFKRVKVPFPKQAYKTFLKQRKTKRGQLETARKDYRKVQKELKKVYQNKKYRIDGNKEFEL